VTIRPIVESDVMPLVRIWQTPEVAARWPDEDEKSVRQLVTEPEAGLTPFVIEVDSELAGFIQAYEEADPQYLSGSMDLMLAPHHHGRGVGPEAIRLVAKWLFSRGHHRITIDPAADNLAARRAYEKVGFREVGVMRQYERDADGRGWHDGVLYDLLEEDLR